MNQHQYTRRVYQNESQLSFKKSLRNSSDTSRNSTITKSGSSKTSTESITTPTKSQVSTGAKTPYSVFLNIKSKNPISYGTPLASKKAQELVRQMKDAGVTFRRNLITSITRNNKNYQHVPNVSKTSGQASSETSYQLSSVNYDTSSRGSQGRNSSLDLSFSTLNANLNGYVATPFATGAQSGTNLRVTAAFNKPDENSPQPMTLKVTPQQKPQTPSSQGTNQGRNMVTTTKLSVLQKKYSRYFKINQELGINLKTNQSHNFRPGAPNNTTVTQGQNPDFYKCQYFLGGIYNTDATQGESRLAMLETPRNKNQKPQSRQCIINQDQHGIYIKSDGTRGKGPALYRQK